MDEDGLIEKQQYYASMSMGIRASFYPLIRHILGTKKRPESAMARTVRDNRLENRTARERLGRARHPYWRSISVGCHIGYYRGPQGGTWIARCKRAGVPGYYQRGLGEADDVRDADGVDILDFAQAQRKARDWFDDIAAAAGKRPDRYTVGQALDDYLVRFAGKSLEKTRHTIERHIRPVLGKRPVCELTTAELTKFQTDLATRRSVYRANRMGRSKPRPDDGDAVRRGKAKANRIFTPLKAALNRAFNEGRVADDTAWRRVKPYPKVSVARVRYFTPAEVNALLQAAEPWFRAVMQGALFTGARWSELFRLQVRDVDLRSGTILFPETKGGRPRHVHLTDEGLKFFGRYCTAKGFSEKVFRNAHDRELGPSHQIRPMRETCEKAGVEPAGFHILRHTYGSTLAMAGVPLAVIAEALGHADERITRKHYAHLSPSYVRDAVRNGLGILGTFEPHPLRLVHP
jgi:integrase